MPAGGIPLDVAAQGGDDNMADEFVGKEHFDEYTLRMDERFLGIEKRMEQGFA